MLHKYNVTYNWNSLTFTVNTFVFLVSQSNFFLVYDLNGGNITFILTQEPWLLTYCNVFLLN